MDAEYTTRPRYGGVLRGPAWETKTVTKVRSNAVETVSWRSRLFISTPASSGVMAISANQFL